MTKRQCSGIDVHFDSWEAVRVEDLKPYPRNNRAHGDEQVTLLAKNIRANGWRWPITVSKSSGYIIAGHGRLQAARLLGVESVPVVVQDFADPREEEAFRIADNRVPELAEVQMNVIKDLLEELDTGDFDMDLTAYTEAERERLMTQFHVEETDAPELKDGDRSPFRQVTFTLHDEQFEEVEAALAKAKKDGGGESAVNENSNGNALAWICGRFNNDQ